VGDAKALTGATSLQHRKGKRMAKEISDEEWLRPAFRALSPLLPGEEKALPVRQLSDAKNWLAEGLDATGVAVHP
jgi:hypothetical protein